MGTMLSQVTTKPTLRPPRIVLYGKGGVGKTTFGSSIPSAVFLPAEEGEGVLAHARLPKPESYEDVLNSIAELLKEQHEYKALVIDTIDHVEPLVWDAVCRERSSNSKNEYKSIEDFGYAKGYVYADPLWIRLLKGLDLLRSERGMTAVVLAHAETKTVDDPVLGAFESFQTKLHKRANALLHEWADIVGYLELERAVRTKGGDASEGAKHRVRVATTTGRRLLHVEDRGGFQAKNRYGLPSPIEIPAEAPWQALRSEIKTALGAAAKPKEPALAPAPAQPAVTPAAGEAA